MNAPFNPDYDPQPIEEIVTINYDLDKYEIQAEVVVYGPRDGRIIGLYFMDGIKCPFDAIDRATELEIIHIASTEI